MKDYYTFDPRPKPVEQVLEPNYVIIDGCIWNEYLDKALQINDNTCSLFRGEAVEEMRDVAPHLFAIETGSEFEKWLVVESKDKRILWLRSEATLEELQRHLRRFLRVSYKKRGMLYFRFYDPVSLWATLPALTEMQLKEFFDKINYVVADDCEIVERRVFSLDPNGQLSMHCYDWINNTHLKS